VSENGEVPVAVPDLLADPTLQLRALTRHCDRVDAVISWVATTELPDPLPFLRGGELVLTTGLLPRAERAWADLVAGLVELPVAALCFGTGLVHRDVPPVVVEAAEAGGLALLTSPVDVPFVQISRWVADRIFAEQYDAVRAAVSLQDRLVQELLSGRGLPGLLRTLHRQLAAGAVAVVEPDGRALARHPPRADWPPDHSAARAAVTAPDPRSSGGAPVVMSIRVEGVPVAELRTERATVQPDVLSFAANILGLEVARHLAVLTGRRERLGQILEDVMHRTISEGTARRRLGAYGLAPEEAHAVVVARVDRGEERLRTVPWTLGRLLDRKGDRWPTALLNDAVVVVMPEGVDAMAGARTVAEHLAALDPGVRVGVSEPRRGVAGLRLGYFEARQAARTGPGVHRPAPLSVAGLLMGNLDLPLRELGQSVLAPLQAHDEAHGAELVATLRAYLAHDCRPARTAQALVLHRNSLRHRLQLIEQLTGRDLDRLHNRLELSLALAALESDGPSDG
jgi:purine catabolism regulator